MKIMNHKRRWPDRNLEKPRRPSGYKPNRTSQSQERHICVPEELVSSEPDTRVQVEKPTVQKTPVYSEWKALILCILMAWGLLMGVGYGNY